MSDQRVRVERQGAVAHVRMNRPEKRNGLDLAMFEALIDAGHALGSDATARAVVLSGEGKAFCAGLDFKSFMATPDVGQKLLERPEGEPANLAQEVAWVWQKVPVPVIASVHGQAFGGGFQIAMGADLRYVRPDAELSVMEIEWGLIPDMSITQTLLRTVPPDIAKELTWTGRIVAGDEAVQLGLATRCVEDPLALALETAHAIAARSPHAIRAAKQLYRDAWGLDPAASFRLETELQLPLLGSKNQMEAVQARFMRREPVFRDPE